jgi:hypothetical protein
MVATTSTPKFGDLPGKCAFARILSERLFLEEGIACGDGLKGDGFYLI